MMMPMTNGEHANRKSRLANADHLHSRQQNARGTENGADEKITDWNDDVISKVSKGLIRHGQPWPKVGVKFGVK